MPQEIIEKRILEHLRYIPDFPEPGIRFVDLTTLLLEPKLSREIVDELVKRAPENIEAVAGMESRGFWFGVALALRLDLPFIPLRKPGKLPGKTIQLEYDLEYGSDCLEMHAGSLKEGQKVLIHDDLLATGGTALAAWQLVKNAGAEPVACSFVIGLKALNGEAKLGNSCRNIAILARC